MPRFLRGGPVSILLVLAAGCQPPDGADSQDGSTSAASAALAVPAVGGMPRAADGRPDLSGVWEALNAANWNLEPHAAHQGATEVLGAIGAAAPGLGVVAGGRIPYRAEALAQREENFANRRTEDPEAKCFRPGIPRATYLPYPFQIFQTESEIFVAYEFANASRSIYMENQTKAPIDSWMGWSNGHWDGDTLVVEVTGLNGESWLDRAGNYTSAAVRVVERFTPIDADHLRYEATIEDPTVFERAWTISMPLYRRIEPNAQLLEFKCVEFAEELMYGHLSKSAVREDGGSDQ